MVTLTYMITDKFQHIFLPLCKSIKITMRKLFQFKALSLFAMALLVSATSFAQQKQQASPAATATGTAAGATITVDYHSPSVKGRKIWGGLVPYDKVWRTGANEATIFTTTKDITIGGKTLKAGKYSLYTIPGEKEWKIIFNSQTGQWGIKMDGSTTDDASKDVLVATATPMKSKSMNESFKIEVNSKGIVLLWENLAVPVMIK
jgi:hypothetical protein